MLFKFLIFGLVASVSSDSNYDGSSELDDSKASAGSHEGYVYDISNEEPYHNLKLVQVVFRNGKRTPTSFYPNDPYLNYTFPPYGVAQLTNDGKNDMFQLGRWLRKRYISFLGRDYYPDIIYALSSDTSRTKMSLLLVLAGLFPPKDTPNFWNSKLNWQPIPYDYVPLAQDNVLLASATCPRYTQELARVFLEEPEIVRFQKEIKNLLNHINKLTGNNYRTPIDLISLYGNLNAEEIYGLKLPGWIKKYYPDPLLKIVIKGYVFAVYNDLLKKLKGGQLVSKLVDVWNGIDSGTYTPKTRKILLYSGHDNTIVNVLSAFNVWKEQYPDFGTTGIFELYKDKKTRKLYVKFLLKTATKLKLLIVPGCQALCPLKKLNQLIANVIPAKDGSDCNAIETEYKRTAKPSKLPYI